MAKYPNTVIVAKNTVKYKKYLLVNIFAALLEKPIIIYTDVKKNGYK
jgi:hypothetical protein